MKASDACKVQVSLPFLNGLFFAGLRSPRVLRLRRTQSAPWRKPLCGLAHQKKYAFIKGNDTLFFNYSRVITVPCMLRFFADPRLAMNPNPHL